MTHYPLAQTLVTTNLKVERLAITVDQLAATVDRFIRGQRNGHNGK